MKTNHSDALAIAFAVIVSALVMFTLGFASGQSSGYRHGQWDAIHGVWRYARDEDGSVVRLEHATGGDAAN
jgi:hypothetical protein